MSTDSHSVKPLMSNHNKCGFTALVTTISVIIMLFCFSFGYTSLVNSRNTGSIGTLLSQPTSSFDRCWGNVSFVTPELEDIQKIIRIPCDTNSSGNVIPLCYNRWYPHNVAYDSENHTECGAIGYRSAKNDVAVGYIFLGLNIISVILIWSADICRMMICHSAPYNLV